MKFTDRINEAVQTAMTEARKDPKQMVKLVGAGVCIVLGVAIGAFQLWPRAEKPGRLTATPQGISEIEQMAKELEEATAEETDAWNAAIAAGEVDPPEPKDPSVVAPLGAKGMNYKPEYNPLAPAPTVPPPDPGDPEQPEQDEPG